jgi:MSHA biogenesis protein MshI
MFSLFNRIERAKGQTGFVRSEAGMALAHVSQPTFGAKPELSFCAYRRVEDDGTLARIARSIPNRKAPAVGVLPSVSYRMLLVESPEVPDDELRAAVRWRIKDLIDFHVDDAVIDVFQMPRQSRGGPNQMLYAIAARADGVRGEVDAAESAGLSLKAIDILELALRNLAALIEQDGRGVALLYLQDTSGVLLLVRQGVLYLARHIETGTDYLGTAGGLHDELVAGLALETRRSLDYFESHYEQTSIPILYTAGLPGSDREQLSAELGLSVARIDLDSIFDCELGLDEDAERRCLPAVGAALRKEAVAL